jgi:hypothetical protein
MAKQIARLLKTNMMADIDMPALAQFLRSQGRKGDTVLAHINPKEAALLQKMGGAGTENPMTGLPEFYRRSDFDFESRYRPPVSYGTTRDNIVDTITAPESQIGRVPRSSSFESDFRGERVPTYFDTPRIDSSNMVDFQRPPGTRITSDYTRNYNVSGAGDFGTSPALDNTAFIQPAPTRPDTYFRTAPGRPDYARENFLPRTAEEEFALERMDVGAQREDQPTEGNIFRRGIEGLRNLTGLSGSELAQLGLAGGLGIQGALAARNLAEQGEEARAEQEAIAAPYRERGAALLAQAEGGQLTPQAQQSLQAMRARLAQGAEARGGVGAQQIAAQVEAFRQQLLANQYDYGMKVSNIGDNLMLGAIRTGLEADRYATQMTNNYYTNMARILGGMGGENENALQQGVQIQQQVRGVR